METDAEIPGRKPSAAETKTERTDRDPDITSADTVEENLGTTSAKTSVGNPDVANADILEEGPATMSAEISGGKSVEANAEISGGKLTEANAGTSGGKLTEANAGTSGGKLTEANAGTLGGKLTEANAGTSGGKLTEANAGTLGGKPAEDERILLLTEGTKKTPTARRVVYYVLCALTVVAVWSVALLPSVLTYSILRSPLQVIYVQTRSRVLLVFASVASGHKS